MCSTPPQEKQTAALHCLVQCCCLDLHLGCPRLFGIEPVLLNQAAYRCFDLTRHVGERVVLPILRVDRTEDECNGGFDCLRKDEAAVEHSAECDAERGLASFLQLLFYVAVEGRCRAKSTRSKTLRQCPGDRCLRECGRCGGVRELRLLRVAGHVVHIVHGRCVFIEGASRLPSKTSR